MANFKTALITGCSTGIGYWIAKDLIKAKCKVFGSVRKEQDGKALQKDLGPDFFPLIFDVTDEAAIERAYQVVKTELKNSKLSLLVNNAGIAVHGPLAHLPMSEFKAQFEVNVFGPQKITQTFLPLLGMDASLQGAPGKIINISSIAGKRGLPFLGPYAASKHALEGWSESLRRELALFGIQVVIVGPGSIRTPIWDKAEQQGGQEYESTAYAQALKKFGEFAIASGKSGLDPQKVSMLVVKIFNSPRPKTRYAIVPSPILNQFLPWILPTKALDHLIAKKFNLKLN
jgi:NAD(P)-dependent dehydrogenase (short-subunit alcohol dehydrogenase family)